MPSPFRLLRREIDDFAGAYWAIWVGTLVNKAGAFVQPFLALYVGHVLGHGDRVAGLVVAAFGGGSFTAGLVGGVLADRIGRRATMLLSFFGGAATMLVLATVHAVVALGATAFALGLLSDMQRPASAAMVSDLVPPAKRARAYGHIYWAVNLGFAIAGPLAGLASRAGYTLLFVVDAATTAICGVVVLLKVPETHSPGAVGAKREAGERSALGTLLADRLFLTVAFLSFLVGLVIWQIGVALPLDMAKNGISPASYGAILSVNGVIIVFVQPVTTRWLTARSRTRVLAISAVVLGTGYGLYGAVSTPLGYVLATAVWTFAEIALLPTTSALVADLAPARLRGRYQGVHTVAWGAASMLGPLAGGYALAGPGSRALWGACFVLMLATAIGHALIGPARERRERAVTA